MHLVLVLLTAIGFSTLSGEAGARELHREKSLYRNIVVRQQFNRRCLVFAVKRGDRNQTCMDIKDPKKLVFPYVRMTFAGLLLNPAPERILVLGLGGGTIPMTLSELFPEAKIDVVEIDEAVYRVAKEYFLFQENDRMKATITDARVFVKRALLRKQSYDFVILDAFTGEYIPEHLMTKEYLEEISEILDDDGVLVANTFSTSTLYDHESETYKAVYGPFINMRMPISGNRVIIASESGLPGEDVVAERARALTEVLKPYNVEIDKFPEYMSRGQDWDHHKRVLTDQYSPANLLRSE